MKFGTVVNAARYLAVLSALVLLYLGNAFAGWPVDWWVPIWALLTLDALVSVVAHAFGGPFGAQQINQVQNYGEFVAKHSPNKED